MSTRFIFGVCLKPAFLCLFDRDVSKPSEDGSCADRAHGTVGAARRRRNRQLRWMLVCWWPLRFDYDLSSAEKSDGASDETSSVIEYMSHPPAVTVAPPDPVILHLLFLWSST